MKKVALVMMIAVLTVSLFSQVKNTATPLKGKWDFQVKKDWEIEEAGDDVIGEVQNIASADDGRIYIMDSKNYKIYIFSPGGKFITAFGKRGEGPGEIKNFSMGNQLFVLKQSLIIVDRVRINYFSLDGTFKKTVIYPTLMRPRAFVSEDIFISAPVNLERPGSKKAKIKLYNVKDKLENTIAEYEPFKEAAATDRSQGRSVTVVVVFGGVTPIMFVKNRNNNLYYGMTNTYTINRMDIKSKKILDFSVEGREPMAITKAVKKELVRGLGDVPQDMLDRIMDGLPEKASFYQDIQIDSKGFVYVFLANPTSEPIQGIDIFSPEGKYLYSSELKVEEEFSIQGVYLRDDLLVIAVEDEEGEVKVAKYSVRLPGLH